MYELRFAKGVAGDLANLTPKERERVKASLRTLAQAPRGPHTKKLKGTDLYRHRTGRYRIIYGIRDERLLVIVLEIMHRGKDYDSLDTLMRRWKTLLES